MKGRKREKRRWRGGRRRRREVEGGGKREEGGGEGEVWERGVRGEVSPLHNGFSSIYTRQVMRFPKTRENA